MQNIPQKDHTGVKSTNNLKYQLFGYLIAFSLILASVPIMEDLLYKRSFDLIRSIKPYHTPELTKFMNVLSHIGEGEAYFYVCFIFYLSGHEYEFTYLIGTYFTTQHWINWLKTQIRSSRPQFDEPSLGVQNES